MKKFLALVIGIVMALSLVTIPAMADAGPGSATFTVTAPEKVERGEQFDVVVSISGTYQMHGLQLHFPFDEDNFEYVSEEKGAVLVDALMEKGATVMLTYEYNEEAGRELLVLGVIAAYPEKPMTMEGELFTLTLKAKTDAAAGDYEMTPTKIKAKYMPTSTSQDVPYDVVSATVTIEPAAA
ncbi:MAG: hypothetical protein IKS90_04580, partial [Clostridia bacterium]|nr:hypothetical protein [Clostridia bacterium]